MLFCVNCGIWKSTLSPGTYPQSILTTPQGLLNPYLGPVKRRLVH